MPATPPPTTRSCSRSDSEAKHVALVPCCQAELAQHARSARRGRSRSSGAIPSSGANSAPMPPTCCARCIWKRTDTRCGSRNSSGWEHSLKNELILAERHQRSNAHGEGRVRPAGARIGRGPCPARALRAGTAAPGAAFLSSWHGKPTQTASGRRLKAPSLLLTTHDGNACTRGRWRLTCAWRRARHLFSHRRAQRQGHTKSPERHEVGITVMKAARFVAVSGRAAFPPTARPIERLWSPFEAAYWQGPDDPNIRVLKVEPDAAEWRENPARSAPGCDGRTHHHRQPAGRRNPQGDA